jgi:DNA ligase-1
MAQFHGMPLYKRDRNGTIRYWSLELENDKYRTHSGIVGGADSVTGWTYCEAKNIGKKNETSPLTQAEAEVNAEYAKKRDRGYHDKIEDVDKPFAPKPMLAQKYVDLTKKKGFAFDFDQDLWFAQPKLDGIRANPNQVGILSRTAQPILGAPHVFDALHDIRAAYPGVILDGELYNHELKDNFNQIVSHVRKKKPSDDDLAASRGVVQYHIYDVMLEDLSFKERQEFLGELFDTYVDPYPEVSAILKFVETELLSSPEHLATLEQEWVQEQGYEGVMLRTNGEYENTRSWNLIKMKTFEDEEFPFVRAEEGNGNWAGMAKRIIVDDNGTDQPCGMRGNQQFAIDLLEMQEDIESVTVRYFGRTPDGKLRMPVVTDFHYAGGRSD